MEQQSIHTEAPSAEPVSPVKGVLEIFYQPAAWFEKLRNNPKVLVPYIILAALTVVFFYLIGDVIVKTQMESPQLRVQLGGEGLPADAAELMWWSTVGGGTFAMMLAPLLAAALAMFWGNIVFAGKASFKAVLSVMLYGDMIFAVGNLLVAPMVLAKESLAVGLNLGVLVANRGLQDPLFMILSKVDLFFIWELIVVGIGLSVIYRFPRNKGLTLSVLSIGLLTGIALAASAIGSMIG